jgi:hypothetical protein
LWIGLTPGDIVRFKARIEPDFQTAQAWIPSTFVGNEENNEKE